MHHALLENPQSTLAPQGTTKLPLSKKGQNASATFGGADPCTHSLIGHFASATFGTMEFGGPIFRLSVKIKFFL